jgi:hypothetical protein
VVSATTKPREVLALIRPQSAGMPAEAIFILILSVVVASGGVLLLARSIAGARLDRAIARFERDLVAPPWPPPPHEASAHERALGWRE